MMVRKKRKRKNERFERERSKVTVTRDWDDSRGWGKNARSNSFMGKGGAAVSAQKRGGYDNERR